MAPVMALDRLSNALARPDQVLDLQDADALRTPGKGNSVRFIQAQLTHAAGVLLRLPQEVISQAIVLTTRFWIAGGWSEIIAPKSVSAATLYLAAKVSFTPVSPRSVINVFEYLLSPASKLWFVNPAGPHKDIEARSYFVSEGSYERERQVLFRCESTVLKALSFNLHVALPYKLALTYVQALGTSSAALARRVIEHLNGALFSPQLVYVTHQPNALAVAAIYLAARETGVKLVDGNWWEVFDVDREDLGFLVVAFRSLQAFAESEIVKGQTDRLAPEMLEAF